MMRPFLVVLFLLFADTATHAGIIDKAFEALEMKDYFKAKHLFHKVLDKERIAANYGLCRVHLEQQNPFYNLDSARVYALRTESLFKTAEKKAQEELIRYGINEESVNQLRKTMYKLALDEVIAAHNLEACTTFMTRFPASPDKKTVLDLMSTLAFERAKSDGSKAALQEFITQYPTSNDVVEAKALCERSVRFVWYFR